MANCLICGSELERRYGEPIQRFTIRKTCSEWCLRQHLSIAIKLKQKHGVYRRYIQLMEIMKDGTSS